MNARISRRSPLVALTAALVAAALLAAPSTGRASDIGYGRQLGLGGMLGNPTGFTLKYFFTHEQAVDFAVGPAWFKEFALHVHADYLYHFWLYSGGAFDLPLYVGVGPKLVIWFADEDHGYWAHHYYSDYHGGWIGFGARVPVGVAFALNAVPLEIFLEIVPGVGLWPGVGLFLDGGLGIRYYL